MSDFKSKRYKEYEKFRINDLIENLNKLNNKDKKVTQLLKSKVKLKEYIMNQWVMNRLKESVKKQYGKYTGFNILELSSMLRSLGVKKSDLLNIHNSIVSDLEFMLAFKASSK